MKKRVLSFIITLVLIMGIIPNVFSASIGLPLSCDQITAKVEKYLAVVGANRYWNANIRDNQSLLQSQADAGDYLSCTTTSKCSIPSEQSHVHANGCHSNTFSGVSGGTAQCWGFGDYIEYIIFGTTEKNFGNSANKHYNVDSSFEFLPGDLVWSTKGSTSQHIRVIYKVVGNDVYFIEGNSDGRCHIGTNHFTKEEMMEYVNTSGSYVLTPPEAYRTIHTCPATPKNDKGEWNYETYKNGGTKILGACKTCHQKYDYSKIYTDDVAGLWLAKKNQNIDLYNEPYEDATPTSVKSAELEVVGYVINAYGSKWYVINGDKSKKYYVYEKNFKNLYTQDSHYYSNYYHQYDSGNIIDSSTSKSKNENNNGSLGNGVVGVVKIPSSWDNLSIRSGPSTSYQIVGSMNNGVQCTVYPDKSKNGWYYVEYNGIYGYASGNQINTSNLSDTTSKPKTTQSASTPPQINMSKSTLNLDYSSHKKETITIQATGDLPKTYHLEQISPSGLDVTWGSWSGNSISMTVSLNGSTSPDSSIRIYLKDDSGNTYSTATLKVNIETNVLLKAPSEIELDYAKTQKTKITVYIDGVLPNVSLQSETNISISAEIGTFDGHSVDISVTANWHLKDTDGILTLKLLDGNGNVMDTTKTVIRNTTSLYFVSYNTNGGYYPKQYPSDYVSQKSGTEYKGLYFLIDIDAPSRDGYEFLGWSTDANATNGQYNRGDHYTGDKNTVLYAIWKKFDYAIVASEDELYVYDADKRTENSPFDDTEYYDENGNLAYTKKTALYGSVDLTIFGTSTGIYSLDWDCDDTVLSIDIADVVRNGETTTLTIGGVVEEKNADLPVTIYLMDGERQLCEKKITVHLRESKSMSEQTVTTKPSESEIVVYVNGEKIAFDVQPMIINDRTMVPMRAIFEALGAKVGWNDETATAYGRTADKFIQIGISNDYMLKDNDVVMLDSPATVISGRTLVPVRAIAESLDCDVVWHPENRSVDITKQRYNNGENDKLIIGWSTYEPMNYYDKYGDLVGFDVELAEYVCEHLGLTPVFVEIPFDQSFSSIIDGLIDCYWNGITQTEERATVCDFSDVYLTAAIEFDEDGELIYESYSVPLSKQNKGLTNRINEALRSAKQDGTISRLEYKYNLD